MILGTINNYFSWITSAIKAGYNKAQNYFFGNSNIPTSRSHEVEDLHRPKLGEKCGVFGVFNLSKEHTENLGFSIYKGLNQLQGRGQDACGVAYNSGKIITSFPDPELVTDPKSEKDPRAGLVNEVLGDRKTLNIIRGSHGIAHTLYSTSKVNGEMRPQPIVVGENSNKIALAHNGNIPDTSKLKEFLESKQIETANLSDSGMIAHAVHYFYKLSKNLEGAIKEASRYFGREGSYCLLIMDHKKLAILRDPLGIRPLSLARKGDQIYVASETSAFTPLQAKFIRDIQPGELLILSKKTEMDDLDKGKAKIIFENTKDKLCAIEPIYLMRPDSLLKERSVSELRRDCGKQLADEFKSRHPQEYQNIDYVVPILESGLPAATGFAEGIAKPINPALIKNFHRRTFMDIDGDKVKTSLVNNALEKIKLKFTLIKDAIKGKVIALVDDSIVRGNTMKALVEFIKEGKPKAIHLLSASPPILYPNFYGIDTPKQKDLIAAELGNDWAKIATKLGSKTVTYLSIAGFLKALGRTKGELELSKFTGKYPIPIGKQADQITMHPKPIYEIPKSVVA